MANQKINELVDKSAFDQWQKLIFELERGIKVMDQLIQQALKMKQTPLAKTYDEAAKAAKANEAALTALNKGLIEQQKIEQQLQKTLQEQIKTRTALKREQDSADKAATKAAAAAEKEASAYNKLSKQLEEARKAAKDLAAQYGINSTEAQKAAKSVRELDKQVKDIDASVGQHQRNVGNYNGTLNKMKGFLIGAISGFLSFNAAIKAGQAIINSTDAAADQFKIRLSEIKEVIGTVARAFATLDFKGLADKIKVAAAAGREYARVMDEVEDRARGLSIQEEVLKSKMLDQELIWRNRLESAERRAAALEKYKQLNKELTDEEVANTKRALAGEIDRAKALSGLTEAQIRYYVTASNASQTQLNEGKALKDQYDALKLAQDNLSTGTSQLGTASVLDAVKGAAGGAAEAFRNNLTPAQLESLIAAEKYSLIVDEQRDKIAVLIKAQQQQINAEKEKVVSTLRMNATIETNIQKQADANANIRESKGETLEYAKSLKVEEEALSPIIDLLIKMGRSGDDIIAFQKRMTEAASATVKGQFDLRKGGAEKLKQLQQEELEDEMALWDAKKQIASEGFQAIASFENSYFDSKRIALDEEYAQLEKQKDQKIITEEQYQKQKEALDAKARKIARDKAISDRILASAQIVYQYTMAQAEMAALSAPTLGQPWVGLLMAMQGIALAAIWAAPLPKLAKGIRNSPEMTAIVGEAGPELVEAGGRSQWVTKETVMHLPKGSNVIPLKDLADMSGAFSFMPTSSDGKQGYDLAKLTEQLARDNEALRRTIKDKETITEVKMRGLYEGLNWDAYVNQNFRR